jgi:hypothetical protein
MKTLKESILQDADIALSMTDDDAKKAIMFSTHYKFSYAICGSASGSAFNMRLLKQLTKNMGFISHGIEYGLFDKQGKARMFANWLDHITFDELGFNISNDYKSKDFQIELVKAIQDYCVSNKIISLDPNKLHMWRGSYSSDNEFIIMISRTDKISNAYTLKLCYKIVR